MKKFPSDGFYFLYKNDDKSISCKLNAGGVCVCACVCTCMHTGGGQGQGKQRWLKLTLADNGRKRAEDIENDCITVLRPQRIWTV